MCYCDKAGGVVCVSVWWFMSVYWDRRLSDGLLEDTNNLPWECKVPWVPNPSPYLQRSHMSNARCPLHHLTTALLMTICKLHAFSCVLQGGYNELHLGKTIASDCQKRFYLCVNQERKSDRQQCVKRIERWRRWWCWVGCVYVCVRERNQPQVLHTFQCLSYTVSMSTPWCPPACSPARLFTGITWLHSGPCLWVWTRGRT